MGLDRRQVLGLATGGAIAAALPLRGAAIAGPIGNHGLDAAGLGVRAGSPDDQSRALQAAIDEAAARAVPLALGPGVYRAGGLTLPAGAHVVGVRGATRLVLAHGPSLVSAAHADRLTLVGLTLDGAGHTLPEGRGLVHLAHARQVRVGDCEVTASGRHGLVLEAAEGEVTGNTVSGA